jgi:glutathione S-transferase
VLRLYFTPNTCALASHIALEHARADYEAVRIDFGAGQQRSAEYMKINPKGRVPALLTERGVLTETPAILVYIAQRFPAAKLAPLDDPFALAEAQAFNSYLCSTVHVAHSHRMRGSRWADDAASHADMQRVVPRSVAEGFRLIEEGMLKGPWVLGEAYSICDSYLYTLAQWLEADGVDTARLPRVMDHRRRMAGLSEVKKALAAEAR